MRAVTFLFLMIAATMAYALPTVEDVEHAVHRGDYASAESMTREVLAEHPNNAKAHYILAELLAHDGKLADARTQAATAQQLDPQIHFTTADRFRQFQSELNGTPARATATPVPRESESRPASSSSSSGFSSFVVIGIIIIGCVFFFSRRRGATPPGYGYGSPYPQQPPPGTPGAPIYPGGVVPPGGGMGSSVAAGLGGLAAGMVAEHLIDEALDRRHGVSNPNTLFSDQTPNDSSVEDRPIDFGSGNDWGNDAGGSDGGGFDSGSGGDWS